MVNIQYFPLKNDSQCFTEPCPQVSDPTAVLVDDVIFLIFNSLSFRDQLNCCFVNRRWRKLFVPLIRRFLSGKIEDVIFGAKFLSKYLGNVGEEPEIPLRHLIFLNSKCPFKPSIQRSYQSHSLILIPELINGKPFTYTELQKKTKELKFIIKAPALKDEKNLKFGWLIFSQPPMPVSPPSSLYVTWKNSFIISEVTYRTPSINELFLGYFHNRILLGRNDKGHDLIGYKGSYSWKYFASGLVDLDRPPKKCVKQRTLPRAVPIHQNTEPECCPCTII